MGQDNIPGRKRRLRNSGSEDPSSAVPLKKRRLHDTNGSSSTTTKTSRAIASPISAAASGSGKKNFDSVYEVPDSEEEREKKGAKPKGKLQTRQATGLRNRRATRDVYELSDSADELPDASAARHSPSPAPEAANRRPLKSHSAERTPRRRSRRAAEEDHEVDRLNDNRSNGIYDSPSKAASSRRLGAQVLDRRGAESSDGEGPEIRTPVVPPSSGRKRRDPLANLAIDGTPKLQGILTPSKRHRAISQAGKSVAFDIKAGAKEGEVYFADLPSKPVKSGGVSKKPPATIPPAKIAAAAPASDGGGDEGDEDDEVCAICSKADSDAPNEIIFCDGCDLAVHQECYGVPVIPDGNWLCKSCSQEDVVASSGKAQTGVPAAEERTPDIPNFTQHLHALQRVLLDRCTGRRRIRLRGQDEAYDKAYQLVEQTITAGEGNSMLIIGARGCGKTTVGPLPCFGS